MPGVLLGTVKDQMVFVSATPFIKYGFKLRDITAVQGVSAADQTALGHELNVTTPTAGQIYVFRANSPKPPVVGKKLTGAPQNRLSTFCGFQNVAQAAALGWSLVKAARGISVRAASNPGREQTGVVPIAGGFYIFSCDKATLSTYGADLGIQDSTALTTATDRQKAFSGATWPRPGKASLKLANGTVSSFIAPDSAPDGWSIGGASYGFNPETP